MWVSIVKVISPVHYEALLDPTVTCPVSGYSFIKLDDKINNYYQTYDIISDAESVSRAGQIVIVRHDKDRRFYRAKVETIIQRSSGYELVLYLVDTAERITSPTRNVRPINEKFMGHTHRAVTLKLPGINPCSCKLDINTMKSEYRECNEWDTSAFIFVKGLLKKHSEARFETFKPTETGELVGKLYLNIDEDHTCINDLLVEENYGIRVLNTEVACCSDESESCTDMPLGASASYYCIDHSVKTPAVNTQPVQSHSALKEWYEMQKELDRKAQEIDVVEDIQLSPAQVNSAACQSRKSRTENLKTSTRSRPAASAGLVEPRHSSSKEMKRGENSSVSSSGPPLIPSSPNDLSFRSISSAASSGSRCVSRGTQYEPPEDCALDLLPDKPSKNVETHLPDNTKAPVSHSNNPPSRPASSAEHLLSRMQKVLNRKSSSQTARDAKAAATISPKSESPYKAETVVQSPVERNSRIAAKLGTAVSARVPSTGDSKCPESTLEAKERDETKVDKAPLESPNNQFSVPAKPEKTLGNASAHLSEASKKQSLPYRVPFGRGYPLKGVSNPLSYTRPGSSTSDISSTILPVDKNPVMKSSSIVTSKTLTETVSAKATNHCPSTSFSVTSFRNNMVDPLGILENAYCRKILICGSMPPKLVLDMPASFHAIEKSLTRMGIKGPSIIQSYAWPAIMRGRNIAVISGPQSGKSMTYLPALVSVLLDSTLYSNIPQGNEPLALVVCSSWRSAKRVFDQCRNIIEGVGGVRALLIHGGGYDETQKIELMNGCEILIATPCALLRLLSLEGIKPTSLNRLCYFVLDDADVLTEEFTDQLKEIIQEYTAVLKKRGAVGIPYQIMAFSTKWTNGLKSFMNKIMPNPLLYCASFHESVIYAGIKIIMHTFPEDQKQDRLLELLKPNFKSNSIKTVICTVSADVADSLYRIMGFISKHVLVAHEELTPSQVKAVRERWLREHAEGRFPILIATDASLDELNIEDATCLIHYDIPEMSKSQFGFRFSCLLKYMHKPTTADEINPRLNQECVSHIITTEKCVYQAHALISLMKRLEGDVPPALKSLAEGFYRGREECKQPVSLCYYLKAFGHCPNQYWCSDRHMLLEDTDIPSEYLPRGGIIRVCISDVRNASHFFGRIAKYQLQDGTWEDDHKTFLQLNFDLNIYFANCSNRCPHGLPRIGDLCAVRGIDASYYRVRILTHSSVQANSNVRKVNIVFIDVGTVSFAMVRDLLKLPIKLQSIPPQAIEIFLTNIKPVDKDQEFTVKAYRMAQDLLLNEEVVGTVALSLGSTLWLKNIIKQTKLTCTGDYVYDFDFRKKLLQQFAMDNPMHVLSLEKLCSEIFTLQQPISIPLPSKTLPIGLEINAVPAYAFLPLDEIEIVSICSIFTPGKFYVTKRPSLDCLEQLMNELEEYFQEKSPVPVKDIYQGMLCVARYQSATIDYYRSRVLEITQKGPETLDEDDVYVFWADYGENHTVKRKDVFSLPDNLLTKLPLQAIECSLANVVPVDDSWTENSSNFMWEQHLKEDDGYKELIVKALRKISVPKQIGNRYEVELYDPSDQVTDVSFAELLCNANHAKPAASVEPEMVSLECGAIITENVENQDEHPQLTNGLKNADLDSDMESQSSESPKKSEELIYRITTNPLIIWWDTKTTVHLKILISGVKNHFIDLQSTHFVYKTIVNDMLYSVDLNLFDKVEHEQFNVSILENFVKIAIPKRTLENKWPRLRKENVKTHWITVDYDHVVVNSSDEEEEAFDSENFAWNTKDQDKTATSSVKKNFLPLDEVELEKSDGESSDSDCSEKHYHDEHSIF